MTDELGLAVIYRWRLKAGREAHFVGAWERATQLLMAKRGALGSRLHRAEDGTWIAYTQWPSRDAWERSRAEDSIDPELSRLVLDAVEEADPPILLTPVADHLRADSRPIADASKSTDRPFELGECHLRVARPTDNLAAVVKFYREGLGFEVLSEFKDHDGFDGVMLGSKGAAYHLEFTRKAKHNAGRAPTEENLLVFYLPDEPRWKAAVARMEKAGYKPVKAFNQYWDKKGKTFEDPDGYRVVLQNTSGSA